MYDDHSAPGQVQHPLTYLTEIERRSALAAAALEESREPSVRLLTEYVQALGELVAQRDDFADLPPEAYTFDEGHAGGCG
ncbi:DUF6269 family protein [Streptomyces sp. NPDC005930]|uniref:DUF6269 family protein n=1 Tax=Streptomyces sp. NPDC005930 TaxID=3364736 RepID=UPI0036747A23